MARFIVVKSKRDLQAQRTKTPEREVTDNLKDWAKHVSMFCADPDEEMLLKVDQAADVDPLLVPFSKKAGRLLDEIELERIKRVRELQPLGLNELFSRARENTQRIALILALSEGYTKIQESHVQWAWDYVKHYSNETVEMFLENLGRSELHQITDQIADAIAEAEEKGMTLRDIIRSFRTFRALDTKQSTEVLALLKRDYGIAEAKAKGRPRLALVSPKFRPKE